MNFLEIAKAWVIAANPTPEQKELADKRIKICNECENLKFEKFLNFHYCGKCSCVISKKNFADTKCPENKW